MARQTPANFGAELREALCKEVLAARAELPLPYRLHKSAAICETLLRSLDLTLGITATDPADAVVAVYAAFPEEVQLDDFVKGAYERGVGVAFPRMMSNASSVNEIAQTMDMRLVSAEAYGRSSVPFLLHPLKKYTQESEELANFPLVDPQSVTMAVVPVVAFDKSSNRLGYGGGNYDRYLTQLPDSCRITGVAFSEQQVEEIPAESHDVSLPVLSK